MIQFNLKIAFRSLVILLLFLGGCELTVSVDQPPHDPKMVVNARLIAGEKVKVDISESMDVLEESRTGFITIDDADVSVIVNSSDTVQLDFDDPYYLNNNLFARAGNTYELIATHPNYDKVSSSFTLPRSVELQNVLLEKQAQVGLDSVVYSKLSFEIPDPKEDNFYGIEIENLDQFSSQMICFESNDPIFSSQNNSPIEDQERPVYCRTALFTDELMDNVHYKIEVFIEEPNVLPDSIGINFYTFDEGSFLYNKSTSSQLNNRGNPFAEPVTVYDNIENGYGIFGGVSVYSKDIAW